MSTTGAAALALLAGAGYFAAFPPLDGGLLGFVALMPLLVAVDGRRPGAAALFGWVTGTVAATALTGPSVYAVALRADRTPAVAIAAGVVVPQVYGAVHFALFAWAVARLRALRDARAIVLVPAAWVATELVRSRLGHACPWTLLAHSQATRPVFLQIADVTGAAGPSFVLAACSAAAALALRGAPHRRGAGLIAAVLVAGTWAYGTVAMRRTAAADVAPRMRIALVQGDVPDAWRTSLARLGDTLARYRTLTEQALGGRPDLVVWPENAVGISPEANAQAFAAALASAGPDAPPLLVGAPRELRLADGAATLRNSAWLLEPGRGVTAVSDKRRLAPFGEASPWSVLGPLARRVGIRDLYSAGGDVAPFVVGGRTVAPLICYEAIYADLVRGFVARGTDVLVNISNDGWFGGRAGMEQHFRAASLRTVETRRWLVRATNAGITAVVDPRGVVVAEAPRDVTAVLQAEVGPSRRLTPYVRFGDWFAWLCTGTTVVALAAGVRRRRDVDVRPGDVLPGSA